MATEVDIKQLLEAGAHFGHQSSRWHPKMAQYIHSKRGHIHIIDLNKTVEGLERALAFVSRTVAEGKPVLLVATKRQSKDIVRNLAEATGQPYVTERWLGGMLTNWGTIQTRIKRLKDLEARMESGELAAKYNKLEVQRFQEEIDQLNHLYGGIKNMPGRPGAMMVFDMLAEANAVREATKLGLPLVALVDTNADPTHVDYPIPCNDDAIKTIDLIADYLRQAIQAGQAKAEKAKAPAGDSAEPAAKTA